ncbi:MAG: DNA-binding protein WhiA [Clostridiales Family XIII bacterium]|jgi:DNA-binding protein WhiA|nr:DNA-binding protein WhiA [Clostridiales Family XIII bacterium]
MSFSLDTKNELAHIMPEKDCCRLAEVASFVRMCGIIRMNDFGGEGLVMSTENPAAARHYKTLLKDCFGVGANIVLGNKSFRKSGHIYDICVDDEAEAERVLREIGILVFNGTRDGMNDGLSDALLKTKCCRKACLRGLFLGAGTLSDPERGYHIEIVCGSEELAADVKRIFNSFIDIHAKTVERKQRFVVYIKDSEQIKDILTLMGAHRQLLKFENVRILKEMRNKANRLSNCDNANLDKLVQAAERQIIGIEKLLLNNELKKMPEELADLAELRLENPSASLSEIGEMMDPPMNKAGVYRRLKKLEKMAENYSNAAAKRL